MTEFLRVWFDEALNLRVERIDASKVYKGTIMGTIRREVTRAWAGLRKLLNTPVSRLWRDKVRANVHDKVVHGERVVKGFTPYFFAPDIESRLRHAAKASERWFQELCADLLFRRNPKAQYKRPLFFERMDTDLHYVHRGHRHGAKRRQRAAT